MKFFKTLLIGLGIFSLLSLTHPFHASITKCEYNPQTQSLEITMRLFTDDLGNAIGQEVTKEISEEINDLIEQYVSGKFSIETLDNLKLEPIFLGRDTDLDLTYVFFEIPSFPIENTYIVSQTIFFDRFDDQTNIVNFSVKDKSGSGYFTKNETTKNIELE